MLIHLTRVYNKGIGMSFGLEKCDRKIIKRRKTVITNGVGLPSGPMIGIQVSYKYLGIPWYHMRRQERRQYLSIVKGQDLEETAQREEENPCHEYASHAAGTARCTKEDMEVADVKTRKFLTISISKSNTQKLYTIRKEGR